MGLSPEIAYRSSLSRPSGRLGQASSRRSCTGRLTLAIASAGTTGTRPSTHQRRARCNLPSRRRGVGALGRTEASFGVPNGVDGVADPDVPRREVAVPGLGVVGVVLEEGLRLQKPMNLMAVGDYREPRGSWFPSVLY